MRIIGVLVGIVMLVVGYFWVVLSWNYSTGERAGWVQKLSKKGWLCKTWEGELAMVSMPGAAPEKFYFTVWDDAVAGELNKVMGKRVSLHYEEKVGLPTSCFGATLRDPRNRGGRASARSRRRRADARHRAGRAARRTAEIADGGYPTTVSCKRFRSSDPNNRHTPTVGAFPDQHGVLSLNWFSIRN